MLALLLMIAACTSDVPCGEDRCSGDAVCVIQLRPDGTENAECLDAPESCADVYQGGSCTDDTLATPACTADAGDLCPSVLPDHGGFTCASGTGYDYLEVTCEDR